MRSIRNKQLYTHTHIMAKHKILPQQILSVAGCPPEAMEKTHWQTVFADGVLFLVPRSRTSLFSWEKSSTKNRCADKTVPTLMSAFKNNDTPCLIYYNPTPVPFHLHSQPRHSNQFTSGVPQGVKFTQSFRMQLALPLHTLQPYALICRYMAPLTP